MSHFFIDRPVFALVLSLLIVLSGLLGIQYLPVMQYPHIVPPEVVVATNYPGTTALTVSDTVAAPLENQINGVEGMLYMKSTSTNAGKLSLTIAFEIGTDPDQATIDVNNRVQAVLDQLPSEVQRQGVTVTKRSSSLLQIVALSSSNDAHDALFISNYAFLQVIDALKRVPGIGDAALLGAQNYAMRIWIQPDRLAGYGITIDEVASALREQNFPYAIGSFGEAPYDTQTIYTYSTTTQGQLCTAQEFSSILLRADDEGREIRLRDVARIELGAQDYSFAASHCDRPTTPIAIYLQPGANALATAGLIQKKMTELATHFPTGLFYFTPFDTTLFVRASIIEVLKTLTESILLVIAIVYLFLQSSRAALIPLLTVPISLIGTCAGMYLLGFSINLLTLFGLILSIGIVVDDAIVVLENSMRLQQQGLNPYVAAVRSMREVTSPVIAIVLVLCAVFVPVGFLGGLTGEMYRQFAVTIAVSVVISGFVALTLIPALCAQLPAEKSERDIAPFFRKFNQLFEQLCAVYLRAVIFLMQHSKLTLLLFLAIILTTAGIYRTIPTSLVPEEDQGVVYVSSTLLPGSALQRTQAITKEMDHRLALQPQVDQMLTLSGFDLLSAGQKTHAGVSFIRLKDWQQRLGHEDSAQAFAQRAVQTNSTTIKDAQIMALCPPPISGMGMTGGFELYLQNFAGASIETIAAQAEHFVQIAAQQPALKDVHAMVSINTPQYAVIVDHAKVKALGLSLKSTYAAFQTSFGGVYINDFTLFGRAFRVYLQSQAAFRQRAEDVRYIFVCNPRGERIALRSLLSIQRKVGVDLIERFNGLPAVKIIGRAAAGYSSGDAIAAAETVAKQSLPVDYAFAWTGSSYQEKIATANHGQAFAFAIVVVFLILAGLYERWSLPLIVLIAIPFAVFGATLAVWLRGLHNDVYFQVGLLTLIGLSAKNAILIVEFAVLKIAEEGLTIETAILEAVRLRFRPIVMTSLAFILGCLPLTISTGAGAASRHSLGTGIVGGMLAATFLAILFLPLFCKLVLQTSKN